MAEDRAAINTMQFAVSRVPLICFLLLSSRITSSTSAIISGVVHVDGRPECLSSSTDVAVGRSPAEIVGSNPTGGMDICLL